MTVSARIIWGLTLLTLLTLSAAFAVIWGVLDRYQERQLDEALLLVAKTEAEEAPANRFTFSARPGPAANDVGPLEKYGIIFDEQDAVLSVTHPFERHPPRLSQLGATSPGRPFDFRFGVNRYRGVVADIPGYPGRRVLLAASREDLDGDSHFLRNAMGTALAVSVAWLATAVTWLVRRSLREHRRIAATLRRMAAGDVDARVSAAVSDRELQRVGNDIDDIAARLGRYIEQQRRFTAHAAHELRSPLAALHGEIQQALRKERSVEEYRKSLTFLLKASGRMKQLADELLELARAEQSASQSLEVSAAAVLIEVVESLDPLARERGISFELKPLDVKVQATPADLGRILRNLLDNAIRHSAEGGVVRISMEAGRDVRFYVRDDGKGVPEGERERIFEAFYRSGEARADGRGAGLGLAIARELARKHGGNVFVADDGNCFALSLPSGVGGSSVNDAAE